MVPSPEQMSYNESVATREGRQHAVAILVRMFALLLLVGGLRLVFVGPGTSERGLGSVLVISGVSVLARPVRRGVCALRRWHRIWHDRCIHCGYDTRGLTVVRCPECGKEPV
jgi:hypothetical protein